MKSLLLLFLATFSLAVGQAQGTPPAAPQVNTKLTLVGWGKEIHGLKYRQSGSLKDTGVIPLFTRSKVIEYSGPAVIEFHKEGGAAGTKKTSDKDSVVATATIPAGLKRVMILLGPQDDRYRALVVPDDLDSVPPGRALVMNLCDTAIAIRANKSEIFSLAPGGGQIVGPGMKSAPLLQMEVGIHLNSVWTKSDNCFLPLPSGYQTVVFFLRSDSAYFKDVDGRLLKPMQMIVLREPVESSAPPAAL